MRKQWVEVLFFDGVGVQNTYGIIKGTLEDAILSKKDDDWVRLDKVRHLNESGTVLEKLEDDIVGTEDFCYLRARTIIRVAPIRPDVRFWEEGKAPVDEIADTEDKTEM